MIDPHRPSAGLMRNVVFALTAASLLALACGTGDGTSAADGGANGTTGDDASTADGTATSSGTTVSAVCARYHEVDSACHYNKFDDCDAALAKCGEPELEKFLRFYDCLSSCADGGASIESLSSGCARQAGLEGNEC